MLPNQSLHLVEQHGQFLGMLRGRVLGASLPGGQGSAVDPDYPGQFRLGEPQPDPELLETAEIDFADPSFAVNEAT
jgi:hypothetical protein